MRKTCPTKDEMIKIGLVYNGNGLSKGDNEVGYQNNDGYFYLKIFGENYLVHRLVWSWHYGEVPYEVDHLDNDKSNNSIENLRSASRSENIFNSLKNVSNKSGYKGVCFHKATNKWNAQIGIEGGRRLNLGFYKSPEEAHQAYCDAAKLVAGEFFNPG